MNIFKPMAAIKCLLVLFLIAFVQWDGQGTGEGFDGNSPPGRKASLQWENKRVSAEFNNIPIQGLLLDLLALDGSKWRVVGDLAGFTTIHLKNMTLEESIRKIMRNNNYSYTLILSLPSLDDGEPAAVSELTIYQGNQNVRFSRLPSGGPARQANVPAAKPAHRESPTNPIPAVHTAIDRQQADREIKAFMDQLLSDKKISRNEYDKALMDMKGLEQ